MVTVVLVSNAHIYLRRYVCTYVVSRLQYIMKSTLKVHNPPVIILLICINDVQGKELSF